MPPTLLTVTQAARLAGVTAETIRRHIREGSLPAVRLGREYALDPAEFAAWLAVPRPTGRHKTRLPVSTKPIHPIG